MRMLIEKNLIKNKLMKKRILLIGPKPPPLGGARIAFDLLCKKSNLFSGQYHISFINIPLFRKNFSKNIFFRLIMLIKIFFKIPFYNYIILHSSANFLFYIGPLIISYSKFFNKKIQIRFFGSKIDLLLNNKPNVKKKILSSDQILLETKGLIKNFQKDFDHNGLIWFPNSRKINQSEPKFPKQLKKIIYVGQLKKEKGTIDLIEAFNMFDFRVVNLELHLVGQIMEKSIISLIKKKKQYYLSWH